MPGAYFFWGGKSYKIYRAKLHDDTHTSLRPGEILVDKKNSAILCGTSNGLISIEILQQEGKKPLGVKEFLQGFRVTS